MPSDLRELLDEVARRPRAPLDMDDIQRRARRGRLLEVAGVGVLAVMLVVGGLVAVGAVTSSRSDMPVIGDRRDDASHRTAPPTTTEPERGNTTGEVTVLAPGDLGVDVLVPADGADGQDGTVTVHHPDGATTTLPIEAATLSEVAIVPDDRGGFSWQPVAAAGGSPPIFHVDADGRTSTVVGSTADTSETYTLVGSGEGRLLVTHRRGDNPDTMTVDLLEVGLDGQQQLVAQKIAGWESSLGHAARLEHAAYTMAAEASSTVVINPPDAGPTTVFEGGEATGSYAAGVGMTSTGQVVALIDDASGGAEQATARLLVLDPSDATGSRTIDVPLRFDVDADTPWIRAAGISVQGSTVVVNRHLEGGPLRPLVHNLDGDTWSVLDVTGRALVAQPAPAESEEPACSQDTDRADAPPTSGDTLDLYLMCPGSSDSWDTAFRFDTDIARTGDIPTDARAILDRLFDGEATDQADRGYTGLDATVNTGTISIRDVTLTDGTLTVDFDFPDTGVGNYSTSAGGMIWHQLITANLFQFDEVQRIAFLADGSCEAYSNSFEGSGCREAPRAEAPWNRDG